MKVLCAEYFNDRLGKWIRYWESANTEDTKEAFGMLRTPIFGDPKLRVVLCEKTGVRVKKYKVINVLEGEADKKKSAFEYKDFSLTTSLSDVKTIEELRLFRKWLENKMEYADSDAKLNKFYAKMSAVDKKIERLSK